MTIKKTPKALIRGFVTGEFGKTNTITLKDFSGTVQNVSAYTGKQVIFRSPDGKKTITCTGAFATDGSDGMVTWSMSSGAPFDRPGLWEGQCVLTATNKELRSYVWDSEVDREL